MNPRFATALLLAVPAVLASAQEKPPAPPKETPQPRVEGSTVVFDSGERLDLAAGVLTVEGATCLQQGPIELFACAPGGKDHESIVVLTCKPQNLHLALIMMGLRDKSDLGNGGPKYIGDRTAPVGDRVIVELEYERGGKKERHRAEDLIQNVRTGKPMERAAWTFSGSTFAPEEDPETGKPTGRKVYLANRYRSLITTYHDPTTLIDNPTAEGGDDDLFWANADLLPPAGTAARVIFRPPTAEEKKEIEAAEKIVADRVAAGELESGGQEKK